MDKKYLKQLLACMIAWSSVTAFGQPGQDRSHLLNPTRPASVGRGSLRRSQTEMDYQTGNLLITGNVAGNRYFRGNVPYGSQYDFRGSLGSDDLNDFIRRSADPTYDRNPGVYTPYFLPSQTVTTLSRAGQSGLTQPQISSSTATQIYSVGKPGEIDQLPVTSTRDYFTASTEDLERELSLQISLLQAEDGRADLLRPETAVDEVSDLINRREIRPERMLDEEDQMDVEGPEAEQEQRRYEEELKPTEPETPLRPLTPEELTKLHEDAVELQQRREAAEPEVFEEGEREEMEGVPQREPLEPQEGEEGEEAEGEVEELTMAQQTQARRILEEYGSFEAFAKDRYTNHMQRGKELLSEQKFYAAADAFELAMIYNRKDPAVYGGRSLALFAAGDYVTSSYLLERAIRLDPEFVSRPMNLSQVLGGSEKLDKRVTDLANWYERGKTPELALLLSYVYYQTGDMEKAAATLEQAKDSLQDSKAVEVLRNAIEEKAKGSEQGS